MRRVLRGIKGPHAGAVYVLGERTTLGRGPACDVQIVAEGVSRQHAQITVEDGVVVLRDLGSQNGTRVGNDVITRHVLSPGDMFSIARTRYVLRLVPPHSNPRTDAVFLSYRTSGPTLRQTSKHKTLTPGVRRVEDAKPTRASQPGVSASVLDALRARVETTTEKLSVVEDDEDIAIPYAPGYDSRVPEGQARRTDPRELIAQALAEEHAKERARQRATPPERPAAPTGDALEVLRRVLDYRELRQRCLRGEQLHGVEAVRLEELSEHMQAIEKAHTTPPSNRQYHRFPCALQATLLRRVGMETFSSLVALDNISAGGAGLRVDAQQVDAGDHVWLQIELLNNVRPRRRVVLETRVVWGGPARLGLMFAGAARYPS